MSATVAGKPYVSLWPLPGGQKNFLETLYRVLEWIEAHPEANFADVQTWMRQAYNLKATSTAPSYLDTIRTMGYLNRAGKFIKLTPAGVHYLQTRDRDFVTAGFLSECIGAWEVLSAVAELSIASQNAAHKEIQAQFPQWKSSNPTLWRLAWLFSLECVEKVKGGYKITEYGRESLEKYSGPVARGLVPGVPKKDELDGITKESRPADPGTGIVAPKEEIPVSLLQTLLFDIEHSARSSDEATEFEKVLRRAFIYLGFQAEHKSGPGDTDVLLIAPLGNETYRVVVDGKSSKHGKISKGAVDWLALKAHRQMYSAEYILVVAPGFSTGDLYSNAEDTGVALITAVDLCEILRLHHETPFSLTDLRALFRDPWKPERPLESIKARNTEIARLQQLIPDIIRELEESFSLINEAISVDILHMMLARFHNKAIYSKAEIQDALWLLASPFTGALRKVGEQSYVLEMTGDTISERFRAQVRRMTAGYTRSMMVISPPE